MQTILAVTEGNASERVRIQPLCQPVGDAKIRRNRLFLRD